MINQVVAKNVYRLRKIAGINQKDVAEKAGISRPAYVAIEKGKSDPRSATLQKIADALNVSVREIFIDIPELKSVRFRMSKVTEQKRKVREQEIIRIAQWLENYNYLEDLLDDKLNYNLSEIKEKDPKKLAQKVRKTLKIGEQDPIDDIVDVINRAGVKLYFDEFPLDDFFGLSIGEKDGGPAIGVNTAKNISIERQIFTAAHEMAHLLLHKESFKGELIDDDRNEEKEANIFASYFLMPQERFKIEVEKYRDLHSVQMVLAIKRIFKVSYRTVLMRFVDEGMADSNVYLQFALGFKRLYGGNLKGHFEPEALTSYDEYTADQEPEGPVRAEIVGSRLNGLVRKALEKDMISLSRAAEILDKTDIEMRELAVSWKESFWK